MGRKPAFDRDAVLFAAANAFRKHGYRDVSIADLAQATGIVAGSIYNAFGDKAALFRAALHAYVHGFVAQRLQRHAGGDATLEDLEQLFLSVLEAPLDDGFGCLVNNSIIEFGREDGIASADIDETLAMVREAIGRVLDRELGPAAPPGAVLQLFVLYHGILTLARSHVEAAELKKAVQSAFAPLKALRKGPAPSATRSTESHNRKETGRC